jgi:hypothetical protein
MMSDPGALDLMPMLVRLGLDLLMVTLLILAVYYRRHRSPDYVFTCFVINAVTFLLCFLMRNASVDLGLALGLFAVFGILRYRTEAIPIRDLTYLFAAIGVGIFNGMPGDQANLVQLVLVNIVLVGLAALLESVSWARRSQRTILYDSVALLAPGRETELHQDLATRTGLAVIGVRVDRIDLLRDAAELTVYFKAVLATSRKVP